MSKRSDTTAALSALVEHELRKRNKPWAREVKYKLGSGDVRVDFASVHVPFGSNCTPAQIEQCTLEIYEVKSCMSDLTSGCGLNAIGDCNYLVLTSELFEQAVDAGKFPNGFTPVWPTPCIGNDEESWRGQIDGWRLSFAGCHGQHRAMPAAQAIWGVLAAAHWRGSVKVVGE